MEHSDLWPDPGLTDFVHGTDLMIFDGMFSASEYAYCRGWGHSTWQKGVELAQGAAWSLAIFHLYPGHRRVPEPRSRMQAIMPTAFIARERQVVAFEPAGVTGASKQETLAVTA